MLLKSYLRLMMCLNQSGDLLNRQYNIVWIDILVATLIYVVVGIVVDIVVHAVFEILCDLVPTRKAQKKLLF